MPAIKVSYTYNERTDGADAIIVQPPDYTLYDGDCLFDEGGEVDAMAEAEAWQEAYAEAGITVTIEAEAGIA
jgi:hypothetical protein